MYQEQNPLVKTKLLDLSIQASEGHYSLPRENLGSSRKHYTHFELALFTKDGAWINPHSSSLLKNFKELPELLANYEEGTSPVGFTIPKKLIETLLIFCRK